MEPATPTSPGRPQLTLRDLDIKLSGLAILLGILIVGQVVLFAQINGVPDLTAQRIPRDNGGSYADAMVGTLESDVTDLRATVDAMSARIQAICAAVADHVPATVSPNPCGQPAPTPAP